MKYLIFDFDGVLGDTLEPLVKINAKVDGTTEAQALNKILSYYDKKTPHGKEKSVEDLEKWSKFYEILGIEIHQQGYNLFDGFIAEISKIQDVKLAIVSSANTVYTKSTIKQTGLDFTHVLGFQDHHSKEEKVKIITKDWRVDLDELYYFTDTKTDFWELEELLDKAKIIGCAWGWQGYDKLNEVLPANQILTEFSDIHLVLPPNSIDLIEGSEYFKNLESWSKRDDRDIVIGGFIKNQEGKILIQKRGPDRRLFPNCWDLSFGGHVEPGESIYEAMQRELFEETGLELEQILDQIITFDWEVEPNSQKPNENLLRREFDFNVVVKGDLENILVEKDKVSEIRWVGLDELEILKENRGLDLYIYNLAKKALKLNKYNNMHYLIFDFDGVLGDTLHDTIKIKAKMQNKSYEQTLEETQAHFSKTRHSKADKISSDDLVDLFKWMHDFSYLLSKTDFPIFTGFIDEIKKINGFKTAIVSSGSKVYIDKVEGLGIDFTHILDVFDHHSKEEKIDIICKDWEVDIKDIYYFTDTQTDVKELINIMDPTKIIGCAWGFQGYDKLLEVLPKEQILKEFSDIHNVIK